MRDDRHGSPATERSRRLMLAMLAACALTPAAAAQAQYADGPRGYGGYGGPPAGYYEDPGYGRARRAPPVEVERTVPVGYNCDAVQQSITGPKPYSCPLPGPRPLGVRCFCNLPIAAFSPPQTAVGRVAP